MAPVYGTRRFFTISKIPPLVPVRIQTNSVTFDTVSLKIHFSSILGFTLRCPSGLSLLFRFSRCHDLLVKTFVVPYAWLSFGPVSRSMVVWGEGWLDLDWTVVLLFDMDVVWRLFSVDIDLDWTVVLLFDMDFGECLVLISIWIGQ
jgi:hypothetical protein